MPDVRVRMAREPAGDSQREPQVPVVPWGRGHYLAKGSNDLGSKRPDVARQLDPELNGGLRAEDLHAHAGAMVWWRGPCGHVWREKVSMRSMRVDDSCPYCKNRKLLRGFNDLATAYPGLAAEWDFGRNGDLGPDGVRFNATKQVWWRGAAAMNGGCRRASGPPRGWAARTARDARCSPASTTWPPRIPT